MLTATTPATRAWVNRAELFPRLRSREQEPSLDYFAGYMIGVRLVKQLSIYRPTPIDIATYEELTLMLRALVAVHT